MAKLGPIGGEGRREPRQLGQMSAQAKGVDWAQWWRDWKAADKDIEAEFEAATAQHLAPSRSQPRRKRRR